MSTQTKSLKLETWEELDMQAAGRMKRVWKVVSTTNTLRYAPGDMITQNQIEQLLGFSSWKVTVVEKA